METYEQYIYNWLNGIDNEVYFWSTFIEQKGMQWKGDYDRRVSKNPPFYFPDLGFKSFPPKVLDVGAGIISTLGIATPKGNIDLYACDPLAPVYKIILDNAGIVPYCWTEFAILERLNIFYDFEFDLVCMHNALDHCFDPILGLYNMIKICKPGGYINLLHLRNEAEAENYNGFHQWNIDYDENNLIIHNKMKRFNVNSIFKNSITISITTSPIIRHTGVKDEQISVLITKHQNPEININSNLNLYDKYIFEMSLFSLSERFNKLYEKLNNPFHFPKELLKTIDMSHSALNKHS